MRSLRTAGKYITVTTIFCFLLTLGGCQKQPDLWIVGKWRHTIAASVNVNYEFFENGTFTYEAIDENQRIELSRLEGTWHFNDDVLTTDINKSSESAAGFVGTVWEFKVIKHDDKTMILVQRESPDHPATFHLIE
jgi:hypothetical protein